MNIRFFLTISASLLILSSCSLRYDLKECSSSDDCRQYEGSGTYYLCQSEECVVDDSLECRKDTDCATGQTCTGNECLGDATDMGDMGGNNMTDMQSDMTSICRFHDDCGAGELCNEGMCAAGSVCELNVDCLGETEICIASVCTEVNTLECNLPNVGSNQDVKDYDKYVLLSSILPMSPPYDAIGPPLSKSIQLAIDEFNAVAGLPGGRRIVWVNCDDKGDKDAAKAAAQHLVHNLRVPSIVGPNFSTPYVTVVQDVTTAAKVFTVTPTATTDNITNIVDDGYSFRIMSPDRIQATVLASRVKEIKEAGMTPKVLVFFKNDLYGNGLFNQLNPKLAELVSAQNVVPARYEDPATLGFDPTAIQDEFADVIGGVAASGGTLAIFIGTTETALLAGGYYQTIAPIRSIFSHGGSIALTNIPQGNEALQPLVEAVAQNVFHPTNYSAYQTRFDIAFPDEPPLTISTLTYDSTVLTLFGMATVAADAEITGTAIRDAMTRLTDKSADEVTYGNPSFITEGIGKLVAGENFDYTGVSGTLDFDDKGDVTQDFLQLTTVKDSNDIWQLTPDRVYLLAPLQEEGAWFDFCGISTPDPTNPRDCGMGRTCAAVSATTELCLDLCAPVADPTATCSPWSSATDLTCLPAGPGGVCAPLLRCDPAVDPPLCPRGQTCNPISAATGVCGAP